MDEKKLEEAIEIQLNTLTEGELKDESLVNHVNALGGLTEIRNNALKTEAEIRKSDEETKLKKQETGSRIMLGVAELGVSVWSFKKLLKFEEMGSIGSRSFQSVWSGVSKIGKLMRKL